MHPQHVIDAAWSVKVFLDHHPGRQRPISIISQQCGLPETQLRNIFQQLFNEPLDRYWEKAQWKQLTNRN